MIHYTVETPKNLLVVRLKSGLKVTEVGHFFDALTSDPGFKPEMNALILATDTAAFPPFSTLKYFDPVVSSWAAKRGQAKWAFVVEADEILTRAEISLKELTLHKVQARCFASEPDAREWLAADNTVQATVDRKILIDRRDV
jgi:hypothetical protein